MTDDSDFEYEEMDLLSPFHGALSHNNDILYNNSYRERICEHENSSFVLGFRNLQDMSKAHLQDRDLDQNLVVIQNEMKNKCQKVPLTHLPKTLIWN